VGRWAEHPKLGRVWIEDGRVVMWVTCDKCGHAAYYEKDEEWGMSHWCWEHVPEGATEIPVECHCEECRKIDGSPK
jgi:hypothetical protein